MFEIMDTGPFSESVHHALDQILLEQVENSTRKPTLRFWYRESSAVPMGRFQAYQDEVNHEYVTEKNVDVVRRITGGGAMYVEPKKVVTYSLYLPSDMVPDDFEESYRELDSWVVEALKNMGVGAEHQPLNDIVCEKGKIGGSAQLRKKNSVLHHATLNYNIDIEEMLKCLRIGKDKISDKAVKSAEKRVAPISGETDLEVMDVVDVLKKTFSEKHEVSIIELEENLRQDAFELARNKFSKDSWNRRM